MLKLAIIIFAIPLFFHAALAQNGPPGLGQQCGSILGAVECAHDLPCCYLFPDYGVCMLKCPGASKA